MVALAFLSQWSRKGADAFPWNEHRLFVWERINIVVMILTGYGFGTSQVGTLLIVFSAWTLSHPFWHDGAYYHYRGKIDVPGYHFFSDSTTSTARFEVKKTARIVLFIASLVLVTVYILLKSNSLIEYVQIQ